MKKFLSLVLAAMMLLSCTSAFAADEDALDKDKTPAGLTDASTLTVKEPTSHFATENDKAADDSTSENAVNTELWLQVDADGQIDVTVPLVLVFKTNINGGSADTAETYKITNNSTANLAVTKIESVPENGDTMKIMPWGSELDQDQYAVQFTAYDKVDENNDYNFDFSAEEGKGNKEEADRKVGGKFQLLNNEAETILDVDMKTGALTFVTKRIDGDTDTGMDVDYGVKLVTVTYTVGISTVDAIEGAKITTASEEFKAAE